MVEKGDRMAEQATVTVSGGSDEELERDGYDCHLCLDEGDVLVECPGCDQGLVTCPKCEGTGEASRWGTWDQRECLACRGYGVVKCGRCEGEGCVTEPCPECPTMERR